MFQKTFSQTFPYLKPNDLRNGFSQHECESSKRFFLIAFRMDLLITNLQYPLFINRTHRYISHRRCSSLRAPCFQNIAVQFPLIFYVHWNRQRMASIAVSYQISSLVKLRPSLQRVQSRRNTHVIPTASPVTSKHTRHSYREPNQVKTRTALHDDCLNDLFVNI